MKLSKGFSLIELMIVIVVVAILAAVALPSYQDSVRKSRRADAKDALARIAGAQERYFFTNNGYATKLEKLGYTNISAEGYYAIGLTDLNGNAFAGLKAECASGGTTYPCFRLSATPQGAQAKDTQCALLSMTNNGAKAAEDSAAADTTDECW